MSGTWDLAEYGPVYALAAGPYGAVLALSWNRDKEGQPTHVVLLNDNQGDSRTKIHQIFPLIGAALSSQKLAWLWTAVAVRWHVGH